MESDIVDRLRRYFVTQRNQWNAADEIKRLQNERDEARRMYLASTFSEDEIIHEMKRHGWKCFKENTDGR